MSQPSIEEMREQILRMQLENEMLKLTNERLNYESALKKRTRQLLSPKIASAIMGAILFFLTSAFDIKVQQPTAEAEAEEEQK
jgi:hypothetical protein